MSLPVIFRTFHIAGLDITESQYPDEVCLTIGDSSTSLTKDQFKALCELGTYSAYRDNVRFIEPKDIDPNL